MSPPSPTRRIRSCLVLILDREQYMVQAHADITAQYFTRSSIRTVGCSLALVSAPIAISIATHEHTQMRVSSWQSRMTNSDAILKAYVLYFGSADGLEFTTHFHYIHFNTTQKSTSSNTTVPRMTATAISLWIATATIKHEQRHTSLTCIAIIILQVECIFY